MDLLHVYLATFVCLLIAAHPSSSARSFLYIYYSKKALEISELARATSGASPFKAPWSGGLEELVHSPGNIGGTVPKTST